MTLLAEGEIEVRGRLPWSSNGTFLVMVCRGGRASPAVYKPVRGERPLWDFPDGLYRREVAAYRLARALGWPIVPETVVRGDAPFGEGSLQRFVEADFSQHYFTLLEREELLPQLRRIALFDLLANNADRKSGHCLLVPAEEGEEGGGDEGGGGHVWAIDHGVCFHREAKLRTVIWDFAGEAVDARLLADVARIAIEPPPLDDLLSPAEQEALARRAALVADRGRFPDPTSDRPYPWPMV